MSDREELRPHVREEAPAPEFTVVVRGGPDTVGKLATHAQRTHRAFVLDSEPVWGVSVFAALEDIGPASLRGLLSGRMETYRLVHLPSVGTLEAAGFTLLPTFGRPHLTLLFPSDAELVLHRLLNALGTPERNPYHGGDRPSGR